MIGISAASSKTPCKRDSMCWQQSGLQLCHSAGCAYIARQDGIARSETLHVKKFQLQMPCSDTVMYQCQVVSL